MTADAVAEPDLYTDPPHAEDPADADPLYTDPPHAEDPPPPVLALTVLYDARCALCRHVRGWLERQWQLVPLEFVPAGSAEAARRFPALDHARTLREITVISDGGEVYEAADAWVVCLWALKGRRALAHRLSTPSGARLARSAVLAAAKWRGTSGEHRANEAARKEVRPTAQGRAGRTPHLVSPSTPAGAWRRDEVRNSRYWQPSRAAPPTAAPCDEHCAPPPG